MADRPDFMRSPIESAKVLVCTAKTGGVEIGEMDLLPASEKVVGIYGETKDAGESVSFIYEAERVVVPKQTGTGTALALGQLVYYDVAEAGVNGSSTGNTLCGFVVESATTADATVEISLLGWISN